MNWNLVIAYAPLFLLMVAGFVAAYFERRARRK